MMNEAQINPISEGQLQSAFQEKSMKRIFTIDEHGRSRRAKVLLVEDDRSIRRIVRASLQECCDVMVAGTASLASSIFRKTNHDIIFLDIELPDGNGQNLLQWMMDIDPQTYAVMFTGHDSTQMLLASMDNGAKGFVSKPYDERKMLYFIQKAVMQQNVNQYHAGHHQCVFN